MNKIIMIILLALLFMLVLSSWNQPKNQNICSFYYTDVFIEDSYYLDYDHQSRQYLYGVNYSFDGSIERIMITTKNLKIKKYDGSDCKIDIYLNKQGMCDEQFLVYSAFKKILYIPKWYTIIEMP